MSKLIPHYDINPKLRKLFAEQEAKDTKEIPFGKKCGYSSKEGSCPLDATLIIRIFDSSGNPMVCRQHYIYFFAEVVPYVSNDEE